MWISCGLLNVFYQLFGLSFWRHPFTADDSLLIEWTNATFLQIGLDEETNSSTSWKAWEWVHFQGHGVMVGSKPPAQYVLIKSPPTGLQWLQFQQIGEAL